jgi:hypothetical protein
MLMAENGVASCCRQVRHDYVPWLFWAMFNFNHQFYETSNAPGWRLLWRLRLLLKNGCGLPVLCAGSFC